MKHPVFSIILALTGVSIGNAADIQFIDTGKSNRLIETEAHILIGGSYVTNNYTDVFPEISDMNSSMRTAWGAGIGVKFNFNRFIAVGTEMNLTFNSTRLNFNVTSEDSRHFSEVDLRNSFRYLNVPIYASFCFNLAKSVKWNVDGGFYYAYGTGGKQKSTIYTTSMNDLGQLIFDDGSSVSGYFNDSRSFINSYYRTDVGLHIATGLTFYNRIALGIRTQYGLKNSAKTEGVSHPSCHNYNFFVTLGYIF